MNKEELTEVIKNLLKDDREPNVVFKEFKRVAQVVNDQLPDYVRCNIDFYGHGFSVYLTDKEFNEFSHNHKEVLFQIRLRNYEKSFSNFPVLVSYHCNHSADFRRYEEDEIVSTPEDVESLYLRALKSENIKRHLSALKILKVR